MENTNCSKKRQAVKKACVDCRKRRALFRYHGGAVKWDHHHNLCFSCWRNLKNSCRSID